MTTEQEWLHLYKYVCMCVCVYYCVYVHVTVCVCGVFLYLLFVPSPLDTDYLIIVHSPYSDTGFNRMYMYIEKKNFLS